MHSSAMPLFVAEFLVWMAATTLYVTSGDANFCPTGCKCGPVEDPWAYGTEFTIGCSNLTLADVMPFHGGEKVDVLDLTGHTISLLKNNTFKGIKPKRILLQSNNVSVIEPGAFVDVSRVTEEIDLSFNKIVYLPQGLDKVVVLKTLKLSGNRKLELQKGSFRGLTALETLDLAQCKIDSIPNGTFDSVGPTLKKLSLFLNELTSIPPDLKQLRNLEELNFDNNWIRLIPAHAFQGMEKLKRLTLSRNKFSKPGSIHHLAFVDLAGSLEDLDFYNSRLTECPCQALSPLKQLRLLSFDNNQINAFPARAFQSLDSLLKLTLDGNGFNFTREMFAGISDTVTKISIRDMRLTKLPVDELAILDHMKWLDASANAFTSLGDKFTHGIAASRYKLEHMKIKAISPMAFSGKKDPVHVDLTDNKLESLDFVTDPCVYEYIDVKENPLVCDCHSLFVALHSHIILTGTCTQPRDFAGMDVSGEAFKTAAKSRCSNYAKTDAILCSAREKHSASSTVSFHGQLSQLSILMSLFITIRNITTYT